MLLRIRWFIMGVAASLGAIGYLATQVQKARQRMTPKNLANSGLRSVAKAFDTAADTVRPERGQR